MPHSHSHSHHHHTHDGAAEVSDRRLWWAILANLLLTLAQIIGGLVSGSLSLIADALHNFSDAASLAIALVAIRIGQKPPDKLKTFGYKRAEVIAALINLTTLILVGLYLFYEAVWRFIVPEPVAGGTVMLIAGIALVIDVFTAMMTYARSKTSMNLKAAFLHNVTDAMASAGVILTGACILLYGWVWMDAVMTLIISGYVLWHSLSDIPKVIHLLMDGTPEHINIDDVTAAMEALDGVANVHHVHIWYLDEQRSALESHVVLSETIEIDGLKVRLKKMLREDFGIEHATLEFEQTRCDPLS
ncbi:MAG: cation transporter [Rhodospirillales bacterium]|nr:cation transporter [Rhodospirillales bacterium]